MVTPSEINTLRDYFTLTDNEIICDICFNSYDIIINYEDVRKHLNDTHREYEIAVSSRNTQEYLKEFYTIHNNTIECKHCEKLYNSWNTHSIIKFHLGVGHETDEDKVNKIGQWIREKYKLNESDGKQYCNNCQMCIQNKPAYLINHLFLDHYNEDNLQYKPSNTRKKNSFDELYDNWIWHYYIRNGKYANCSVCINNKKNYIYIHRSDQAHHMRKHMREIHNVEYVPTKSSEKNNFTVIQDCLLYCDLCDNTVDTTYHIQTQLQDHLAKEHTILSGHAEIFRGWVYEHIDILPGFQKYQCQLCKKMLRKMCSFSLYMHLTIDHELLMSFEISQMGKSSNSGSLLSSDQNVTNIPISSMNQQPGTSQSFGIEVRDVDCDRDNTMGNLKRKLSGPSSSDKNVKDIGTSSGEPQAGSSKDLDTDDRDSGMKKVIYDDNNSQSDELTSLSSNPVNFDELMTDIDSDISVHTDKDATDLDAIDIVMKKK